VFSAEDEDRGSLSPGNKMTAGFKSVFKSKRFLRDNDFLARFSSAVDYLCIQQKISIST
jgi:hypothetical protein